MTPEKSNRPYYPALDGLRGVAILMVIFLHNFGFMNYFFFGWLGVDLFFVLSGFLITDILLNTLHEPNFLRNFYLRRVLRIFPLFYLVLIISLFVLPLFQVDMRYYQHNQLWFWSYLQNWLFVFNEPSGNKMLLHTWSLGVEEQFYLVWPMTILIIRRPRVLLAVAAFVLVLVGVARYILWTYQVGDLAYASLYTFTRIDGLCIGCMLALLMRISPGFLKKYTSYIVLLMAAINFGFYFFNGSRSFTLPYLAIVGYTTFAVLFGILVYEAVTGNSKLIRFLLDNRLLKFFGRISYGLYVYHWPVYILSISALQRLFMKFSFFNVRSSELVASIAATALAVIISVISYYYFENYFLKLKKRLV